VQGCDFVVPCPGRSSWLEDVQHFHRRLVMRMHFRRNDLWRSPLSR
jgi:hypothetical protein